MISQFFAAEYFRLPLPPPSQAHNTDFKKGANFAITGATALEYSFFKAHGIDQRIWNTGSINTQIGWLQAMKPSLCKSEKGRSKTGAYGSTAFFYGRITVLTRLNVEMQSAGTTSASPCSWWGSLEAMTTMHRCSPVSRFLMSRRTFLLWPRPSPTA
jgi:hypothetical protein